MCTYKCTHIKIRVAMLMDMNMNMKINRFRDLKFRRKLIDISLHN
jgi:hypothetical protein